MICSFVFIIGCSPKQISIHNDKEAITFSREKLIENCEHFHCDPKTLDAPVKVDDMTSYTKDYSWFVQFSSVSDPNIGAQFNVSKYGEYEASGSIFK